MIEHEWPLMQHLCHQTASPLLKLSNMRFFLLAAVLLPVVVTAQTPPPTFQYNDGLTSPGAPDDAAPIDLGQKWSFYTKRIISPSSLTFTALTAGVRQIQNSPGKWGRGADGYGKRYATNLARTGIKNVVAGGINSATHIDPRFFRAPDGTNNLGRFKHALAQVVIAHTDNNGRSFAYGSVIGAFAAGEAGSLWQPRRSDGRFGDGLVYGGFSLMGDAGRNVFREFWPDIHRKFKH